MYRTTKDKRDKDNRMPKGKLKWERKKMMTGLTMICGLAAIFFAAAAWIEGTLGSKK